MTDEQSTPRVELRLRDPTHSSVDERQRRVYERLAKLHRAGEIADVSVEVWGKQVRARTPRNPTDDALVEPARAAFEEFEAWAKRNDSRLEPAFSTHTYGSIVGDEPTEVIRFPVVCLAVYDGDDLLSVVPRSTDGGVRTVDDCLATLRSRDGHPAETCE
ncbi:HTH domain-containing protein [Haloplanus halophilus]|uniref:HTH domain-containing protein n=1 Tax=Haloplanus halophilus TaxID=2949993 RepID=UPI00203E658E|nr:HTH domain-containing protein [Haloplanus sp. GDY1]